MLSPWPIRRWQLDDKPTVGGRDAAVELTGMYLQRVGVRPTGSAKSNKARKQSVIICMEISRYDISLLFACLRE